MKSMLGRTAVWAGRQLSRWGNLQLNKIPAAGTAPVPPASSSLITDSKSILELWEKEKQERRERLAALQHEWNDNNNANEQNLRKESPPWSDIPDSIKDLKHKMEALKVDRMADITELRGTHGADEILQKSRLLDKKEEQLKRLRMQYEKEVEEYAKKANYRPSSVLQITHPVDTSRNRISFGHAQSQALLRLAFTRRREELLIAPLIKIEHVSDLLSSPFHEWSICVLPNNNDTETWIASCEYGSRGGDAENTFNKYTIILDKNEIESILGSMTEHKLFELPNETVFDGFAKNKSERRELDDWGYGFPRFSVSLLPHQRFLHRPQYGCIQSPETYTPTKDEKNRYRNVILQIIELVAQKEPGMKGLLDETKI